MKGNILRETKKARRRRRRRLAAKRATVTNGVDFIFRATPTAGTLYAFKVIASLQRSRRTLMLVMLFCIAERDSYHRTADDGSVRR